MTLDQVHTLIKGKKFNTDEIGTIYSFVGENTLNISSYAVVSVNYELYKEGEDFYMKAPIKSNDFLLDIHTDASPVSLSLCEKESKKPVVNLVEM